MTTVKDKMVKTITCVDGDLIVEVDPLRVVSLGRGSVPELPDEMTTNYVAHQQKRFRPERVTITYREGHRGETTFCLDEVVVSGPNIRKDGSPGEQAGSRNFWVMPDADIDEVNQKMVMSLAGEYVVPDWLMTYVTRFDPLGSENPFTAVEAN
jgi:hypothetical protein